MHLKVPYQIATPPEPTQQHNKVSECKTPRTLQPHNPQTPLISLPYQAVSPHASPLLLNNNPLGHTIDDLGIKLGGAAAREADLLRQVIRQDLQQISIVLLVQQRRVRELGVLVAAAADGSAVVAAAGAGGRGRDAEVEVEGCGGGVRELAIGFLLRVGLDGGEGKVEWGADLLPLRPVWMQSYTSSPSSLLTPRSISPVRSLYRSSFNFIVCASLTASEGAAVAAVLLTALPGTLVPGASAEAALRVAASLVERDLISFWASWREVERDLFSEVRRVTSVVRVESWARRLLDSEARDFWVASSFLREAITSS